MISLFASLLVFWLLLNGSLAGDVVMVGAAVSLVIAFLFRDGLAIIAQWRPASFLTTARYLFFFLKELVKANLHVAKIVLAPSLPLTPGFVKVRTKLKSSMGRLLLANSITLTPGTLTVDMDGEWLYIHWVSVDSTEIEAATVAIVSGFEEYLEVMYG